MIRWRTMSHNDGKRMSRRQYRQRGSGLEPMPRRKEGKATRGRFRMKTMKIRAVRPWWLWESRMGSWFSFILTSVSIFFVCNCHYLLSRFLINWRNDPGYCHWKNSIGIGVWNLSYTMNSLLTAWSEEEQKADCRSETTILCLLQGFPARLERTSSISVDLWSQIFSTSIPSDLFRLWPIRNLPVSISR